MPELKDQLFQSFCDAMPLGVCLVDVEGRILYWNAAAEGITGYHSHEVLGRDYRGDLLLGSDDRGGNTERPELHCPVKAVLRDGRAVAADLFLRHKDGHRAAVHVDAFPLRGAGGELRGVAEILDCRQGKQEAAAWPGHSEREFEMPMGLPAFGESREHLQMMLESQAASSAALILIELAEHHAFLQHGGTALLRQALRVLAKTVAGLVPPHSYMGCWIKDRLIVLVPECSPEALEELKGRLARVGSSCALKWWGDRMPIGTLAAACYLDPSQTMDQLIDSMEQELNNKKGKE